MTGRNCLWLDLNFVTLNVFWPCNDMNGRLWGCSNLAEWWHLPYCLNYWQVVKSQCMKSWLVLIRFWNEIDWQFSDPRIVTGPSVFIHMFCNSDFFEDFGPTPFLLLIIILISQKDHIRLSLDDLMQRFRPSVEEHRYTVKFVPIVDEDYTEEDIARTVSYNSRCVQGPTIRLNMPYCNSIHLDLVGVDDYN